MGRTINTYHCDNGVKNLLEISGKSLDFELRSSPPDTLSKDEILIVSLYSNKKEIVKIPELLRNNGFCNPIIILSFQSLNSIDTVKSVNSLTNSLQTPGCSYLRLPFSIPEFNKLISSSKSISSDELINIKCNIFDKKMKRIFADLKHNGKIDFVNKIFIPIQFYKYISAIYGNQIINSDLKIHVKKFKKTESFKYLIELNEEYLNIGLNTDENVKKSEYLELSENIKLFLEQVNLKAVDYNPKEFFKTIDNVLETFTKIENLNGK